MAPLHKAASEGQASACSILLEYGANINNIISNRAAIHYAVERGHLEVIDILIKYKADLDVVDAQQMTPLAVAIDNNFGPIAIKLINAGASLNILFQTSERDDGMLERDRSPLHVAVLRRNVEVVQACLASNADPNAATPDYYITPLHYASKLNEPVIVSLLVDAGANIDASDQAGNTPLHYSAYDNRMEIVRVLLDAGALTDKKNNDGKTAADIANKYRHRDLLYMINTASYTQPLKYAIEALQDQVDEVAQENVYLQKEVEAGKQFRDALESVVFTLMTDVHKYYNEFRESQNKATISTLNEDFVSRVREIITQKEITKQTEIQNAQAAAQNHGMTTRKQNSANSATAANKLRAMISGNNTTLALGMLSKPDFCESITDYLPDFLMDAIKMDNDDVALAIVASKHTRVNVVTKTQLNDTPLHVAVKLEKHAVIGALAARGAYLNKKNIAGQTPASLYSGLVVRKRGIPGVRNLRDLAPQDSLSHPDLPVCLFCNVNPPELQLLPCGHRPVCQSCFVKKRPTHCPRDACRKNFSGYKLIPVFSAPSTCKPALPPIPGQLPSQDVAPCSSAIFTSCLRNSALSATALNRATSNISTAASDAGSETSLTRTRSPSSSSTSNISLSGSNANQAAPRRARPPMSFVLPPKPMSSSSHSQASYANNVPSSSRNPESDDDRASFSSKHSSENSVSRLTDSSIIKANLAVQSAPKVNPPMDFCMPKYQPPSSSSSSLSNSSRSTAEVSRSRLPPPTEPHEPEVSIIRIQSVSSNSTSTGTGSESSMGMKMTSVAPPPKGKPPMDFSIPRYVPPSKVAK